MTTVKSTAKSFYYYMQVFSDTANLPVSELKTLYSPRKARGKIGGRRMTGRLTFFRESCVKAGYSKAVEAADVRFIAEHRGYESEKAWEKAWAEELAWLADPTVIPKDAL